MNCRLLPTGSSTLRLLPGPSIDGAVVTLDVYDGEPKVNPGYLTLENVTLLPHLGSATMPWGTGLWRTWMRCC
jgi:hypothetical protein